MSAFALVMIAASERDADLYYATRFLAPDQFIYMQYDGRREIVMSDLELDRAKAQAQVDTVHAYSRVAAACAQRGVRKPSMYDVIASMLRERQIQRVIVPASMPIQHAEGLRAQALDVQFRSDPFFPERVIKTDEEVGHLTEVLRHTEAALEAVLELIRRTDIQGDTLVIGGKPLTAEYVKKVLHLQLMERDCIAQHTIVACGVQACDPHQEGSGLLRPHQPIVIDVFPQHARTRYFADITRTVVRGKASEKLTRMYRAVQHGQEIACGMLKAGIDGRSVHQAILHFFEQEGFQTGEQDGRMQGFFHGTGHGLGLEVHEPPRVGAISQTLEEGAVVTVEPGLYYLDAGGVRLEDDVVVTATGCRNLTRIPKVLEL